MHARPKPPTTGPAARNKATVRHGAHVARGRVDSGPRAGALVRLGAAQLWSGEFADAKASLDDAGRTAVEEGHQWVAAEALEHRGLLSAMCGRLTEAHGHATSALLLAAPYAGRTRGHGRIARLALALVGWHRGDAPDPDRSDGDVGPMVALLRTRRLQSDGDVAAARAQLQEARRQVDRADGPAVPRAWLAVAVAEQSIVEHRPRTALELLSDLSGLPDALVPMIRLAAVRALLAGDDPARARAMVAPLFSGGNPDIAAEAWLLEALAADRLRLEGAVCIALTQALDAAAPEGIRRPFLTSGRSLLDRHRDLVRAHSTRPEGLLPAAAERQEPGLVDPITERETVVLRYLPTLLTAREIASELYVSPNTVKTQVKSIYRKLSVRTRRAAVDRARRLGLL